MKENGGDFLIRITDLQKAFGEQKVLKGISFEVKRGETVAVLGRSGGGKSVLLKLIIGLQAPDASAAQQARRKAPQDGTPESGTCSQVRTMMSLPTTIPSTARVANEFTSSQASGRLSNSAKRLASRLAARQGTVLPHLRPSLDLCHPAQYRRVADEWVTQMLRQGDGQVFKKYSQMKLQMKREGLEKLNRRANEMPLKKQVIELAPSACSEHDMGTVLARSRPEIIVRSGNKVGKYFRINPASHVGA